MAQLTDLPSELLQLILETLGGRELRRDVRNLALSRQWYDAAIGVYHSGLDTSDIKIYGCDIPRLTQTWGYTGKRRLMHKNTRGLQIRIYGFPWDEEIKKQLEEEDSNPVNDVNASSILNDHSNHQSDLTIWRESELTPALDELFEDLTRFSVLESISFEASWYELTGYTQRVSYLSLSTAARLLRNLPLAHELKDLTFDLASEPIDLQECGIHMCSELSKILPHIENVRVRLQNICPDIFHIHEQSLAKELKLKKLIIKLHRPSWNPSPTMATPCTGLSFLHNPALQNISSLTLTEHIFRAARFYAARLHSAQDQISLHSSTHSTLSRDLDSLDKLDLRQCGFSLFRISSSEGQEIDIYAIDVLTSATLYPPEEFFIYEDDGLPSWFEDREDMIDVGAFGLR